MEIAGKMPKHRTRNIERQNVEVVEVPEPEFIPKKLRLLIDANLKITGKYSGRNYLFNGAGSVEDVDQIDVEWLLEKRQGGRQCCGGGATGNVVFELTGDS